EQMVAFVEKANEVMKRMTELMLKNQKEAFEYAIAQERAHCLSMARTYQILGSLPQSIEADKGTVGEKRERCLSFQRNTHHIFKRKTPSIEIYITKSKSLSLENQKATIRTAICVIGDTFKELDNLFLEDENTEIFEQRKDKAKSMAELNGKMDLMCTQLINAIQSSTNVQFELRENASKSVVSLKSKSSDLDKEVGKLRHGLKTTPYSIGFEDLHEIRNALNCLNSASDAIPTIQKESTSIRLVEEIGNLAQFDRENFQSIERNRNVAIENSTETEESEKTESENGETVVVSVSCTITFHYFASSFVHP
ncbi:hypothetical protein PFISCL1PPCAC_5495, partial [Pristionchus fissidentatus]